ncbi:hypothetical protein [Shewanella mangrovi]|uniref:hypothetical protein n=1 Tax=Shewanella mangrovi TaxID=1515746 RepID=UPI00068CC801|nr:hypothetical protein [Shewanella mangrovi]
MTAKQLWYRRIVLILLLLLTLVVLGFLANEAHNEVYYLCGNFTPGVPYASVIEQLDTSNLSDYTIEQLDHGKRITHSSALNLHLFQCKIEIADNGLVTSATYQ